MEARATDTLEAITLQLQEIEEFFNQYHDPGDGRFTGPGGGGSVPSSSAHATLNQAHGLLGKALDIVGQHTMEGSLIARVQNGIREVQKGSARRKAENAVDLKAQAEAVLTLPRWRDTNPSKSLIGRVGQLVNKAANTIQQKWKREPEFRKEVYKEVALAISGLGLHFFAAGAALETLGGVHAAVEATLKSVEQLHKLGMLR